MEIRKVERLAQHALDAARAARSKTDDLLALRQKAPPASEAELQAAQSAVTAAHEKAHKAAEEFSEAVKSANVKSVSEAAQGALEKAALARTAAESIPAPGALGAAAGAGAIANTRAADDEAIQRLQDSVAAFRISPEMKEQDWAGKVRVALDALNAALAPLAAIGIFLIVAIGFWVICANITAAGSSLFDKLANNDYARGLITFILALGTMLIAVVLTTAALLGGEATKEGFVRAKEVLTVLIGVFGTILGFYFGTASSGPTLKMSAPTLSVSADSSATAVAAWIEGGKPPYTYTFAFDPDAQLPKAIKDIETSDGRILQVLPATAFTDKGSKLTISVVDAEKHRLTATAAEPVKGTKK